MDSVAILGVNISSDFFPPYTVIFAITREVCVWGGRALCSI